MLLGLALVAAGRWTGNVPAVAAGEMSMLAGVAAVITALLLYFGSVGMALRNRWTGAAFVVSGVVLMALGTGLKLSTPTKIERKCRW